MGVKMSEKTEEKPPPAAVLIAGLVALMVELESAAWRLQLARDKLRTQIEKGEYSERR